MISGSQNERSDKTRRQVTVVRSRGVCLCKKTLVILGGGVEEERVKEGLICLRPQHT